MSSPNLPGEESPIQRSNGGLQRLTTIPCSRAFLRWPKSGMESSFVNPAGVVPNSSDGSSRTYGVHFTAVFFRLQTRLQNAGQSFRPECNDGGHHWQQSTVS